jgi:iron complex transport system ATP-binding protein
MKTLTVQGLGCAYGAEPVLDRVDLELHAGELLGLVGPNGAGKSTLLRCIAGLMRPSHGHIALDHQDLAALRPRAIAQRVAVVPQTCFPAFPIPVEHFVGMGRFAHERFFGGATPHDQAIVDRCLGELALLPLRHRPIDNLSGGEFRRVLIAQALTQEPELLLLDEPVQQLDLRHQLEVMEFARQFAHRPDRAGLVVLHELNLAARFCDRLAVLHGGGILALGTPEQVLTDEVLQTAYGVSVALGRCPATAARTVVPIAPAEPTGR